MTCKAAQLKGHQVLPAECTMSDSHDWVMTHDQIKYLLHIECNSVGRLLCYLVSNMSGSECADEIAFCTKSDKASGNKHPIK